jgi:shikimate dehydrogenase
MTDPLPPCERPTMYFIGVSTQNSSIMRVFPRWAEVLGILDATIRGYDAPLRAPAEDYRRIVEHIREDPLAMGALVTAHKIDLLEACRDLFDELDAHARLCGEVSSISKRDGRLIGHAKDPITSAASWRAFVPDGHWAGGGEVLCLGAGGSAVAISVAVAGFEHPDDRPAAITFVNRSPGRIDHLRDVHAALDTDMRFAYHVHDDPRRNDALMEALPPGSMVINATGMGKDLPGSPITDAGRFPERGLAWELNYRGALDFLHQAQRQRTERQLIVEDGWVYFLHGWSSVIAEVFDLELDDERFAALDRSAAELRPS